MALHTDLPIYKRGLDLVKLAVEVQRTLPRDVRRQLGGQIQHHCMEMLGCMAMANATKHAERTDHIEQLLAHKSAAGVLMRVSHDAGWISHKLWANSVQQLDSIGRQGGGWLKKSKERKAPAA